MMVGHLPQFGLSHMSLFRVEYISELSQKLKMESTSELSHKLCMFLS